MVVGAVAEVIYVLRPVVLLEERSGQRSVTTRTEARDRYLVCAERRAVTSKNVCALVSDVGGLDRHRVGQLELHGGVPGVHRRQPLFVRQHARENLIRQEELAVRRQRPVHESGTVTFSRAARYKRALNGRSSEAEEFRERRSAIGQGEGSIELAGVRPLHSENGQVLCD